jgi:hypothetical protein
MWRASKLCLRAQIVLQNQSVKFADVIILGTDHLTCLSDVSVLMSSNMLKLNQDKTELIVFALKHRVKEFSECCLSFDGTIVTNASFVKNLGIFFDKTLCMQKQASAIANSCYFQIRNIERNRSYTSEDAFKTLVCCL